MNNTLLLIIVGLLVIAGLMLGAFYVGHKLAKPVINENTTIHEHNTMLPIETRIIRENVPAVIDTVGEGEDAYEVAYYSEQIVENDGKVKIGLNIDYNEKTNLFNVGADINVVRDSIYVEKITTKTIEQKPPFVRLTGQVGIGFGKDERENGISVKSSDVAIGVKFVNRYSVLAFVDIDLTYGLRFGVDF